LTEHLLVGLTSILVLGIGAQWLAWRSGFPAILLLLLFGLLIGPVFGLLRPDALFGPLLPPIVALSVAVILFEGGLSLNVADLPHVGSVVRNLLSVGMLMTWLISAGAAYFILGFGVALAALLGAVLVVTGPTVIGPLLMHVRPAGRLGPILRWEGIVIDPIGAILAVLVFEAILTDEVQEAGVMVALVVVKTVLIGGLVGLPGAGTLILLFKRFWVPDYLHNPVALLLVVSSFTVTNLQQEEAGLLTVTVMGIILANQQIVPVKHVIEFKESLGILLISSLFILLAARIQLSDFANLGVRSLLFLAVLMLLARPAAVALATLRSDLNWRERLFLAWLAPRGIVAASVSSVFALRLMERGYPAAESLVPVTFLVIIGTVAIYSLSAGPLARWLDLAKPHPQGVLIVGAHSWARTIAKVLQTGGYPVLVADTNWGNIAAARLAGLPAYYGSTVALEAPERMNLDGIGRLLALTSNDEVNALAAMRFAEFFSRAETYQLFPKTKGDELAAIAPQHLRGRLLFALGVCVC
jgi:NhaP-type Na+/H+ or K+/H+ antiporter